MTQKLVKFISKNVLKLSFVFLTVALISVLSFSTYLNKPLKQAIANCEVVCDNPFQLANPAVDEGATIGDFVWNDTNLNGFQDSNETGVNNVTVTLRKFSDNTQVAVTTTDSSGLYAFNSVAPDDYYLQLSNLPSNVGLTTKNQTTGGATNETDSDFNPSTLKTDKITITLADFGSGDYGGCEYNFDNYSSNTCGLLEIDAGLIPVISSPTVLQLSVNLAGSFDNTTDSMTNLLRVSNLVPTSQPYNFTPFSYSGSESVSSLGVNVVDWIIVEVKNTSGTVVQRKAALLQKNGQVFDASTQTQGVILNNITVGGNYNVIVRHRNHLAISTSQPITITPNSTTSLDFRSNVNVKGSNQQIVGTTNIGNVDIFGMRKSNVDGNGEIISTDRTKMRNAVEAVGVYSLLDINMDGSVDSTDRATARLSAEASESLN